VVELNTPDVNLAGALAELPSNPLDAASQMALLPGLEPIGTGGKRFKRGFHVR
jgi:hypothetical protein